jgi:hypothetical protein
MCTSDICQKRKVWCEYDHRFTPAQPQTFDSFQHQQDGLCGVTVKLAGEKLNPHQKVSCRAQAATTRFIPSIKDFTVFQQLHGEPFIVFRAIALPMYQELVSTTMWAGVENLINFMFRNFSDVLGQAQSPPKPGPFKLGPAWPTYRLESGLGWASNMRKLL